MKSMLYYITPAHFYFFLSHLCTQIPFGCEILTAMKQLVSHSLGKIFPIFRKLLDKILPFFPFLSFDELPKNKSFMFQSSSSSSSSSLVSSK